MPSEFVSNLLTDRVEFKLYAAEKHLNNLQEIQLNYANTENDDVQLRVELEIDCFLAQLLGTVDCLLALINSRLELGIATGKLDLASIQSALNARTKSISLVTELQQALEHNRWLWTLKEFRNQTMQKPSHEAQALLFDDNTSLITTKHLNKSIINTDGYISKNLIAYFRQSVKRIRELVNTIRMKEPLLK
jgi:hypothetical protein